MTNMNNNNLSPTSHGSNVPGTGNSQPGRRFHIAHRRSPSEVTPLVSMLTNNPNMDPSAIEQQLTLLQLQAQANHQQMVNMHMNNMNMSLNPALGAQMSQMGQMGQIGHMGMPQMGIQPNFQFPVSVAPNMMQGQQQSLQSHRRTPSGAHNAPPPAPSAGASDNGHTSGHSARGGRGGGHQRRHSLALAEARQAAADAERKRTNNPAGFQFPAAGSSNGNDETTSNASSDANSLSLNNGAGNRGGRGGHGRSQSVAVGGRGGQRGHSRTPSRNFDGNWRQGSGPNNVPENSATPAQQGQNQQQGGFQPSHRSRGSVSHQSISAIYNQPMNMASGLSVGGPMMMMPGMNPMQLSQLQAMQVAGQLPIGNQHAAPLMPQQGGQQNQQQSRKTLFTPYLPQNSLPELIRGGNLVQGILRVNKKNRSDAYVTTADGILDADIFICGSKDRNRALEGDLVAVELLDVDEVWSQKREKEEKKKRKDHHESRSNSVVVGEGLTEGGIRRRGSLRERPTQKRNDDVEVEGQSLLLVEEEEINDEQKPLYAGHIVAVIDRAGGQMFSGTLGLLRPSSQATKDRQDAERAARDGNNNNSRPQQTEKPKIVWFKPTDKRVPLIAIPTEQAPRDFVDNHAAYADRIFVASIKRWPITSLHPFGTLVEMLGTMGDVKVETEALLRDNNFGGDSFSDAVIRSINLADWSVDKEPENEISERRDFRGEKVFTVDFGGSIELGYGVHLKTYEEEGKELVEIGVHVPDVTHFVKPNSLVDREARKRGTAVHLLNRACPMLPHPIWADACALKPAADRLTFTIVLTADKKTGVLIEDKTWVGKGIVKSVATIDLPGIDLILGGKPENGPISSSDIRTLHFCCERFREKRLSGGSEPIAPLRLLSQLDDENMPVRTNIFETTTANETIEELTHTINFYVAQRLLAGLPEQAFLRRHMSPNPRRLQTFVDRMTPLGFDIDATSSGRLQNSLFKVGDDNLRKGMETLLFKTMNRAKYFVPGKTNKELWPHYALNLPIYTHFTRPTHRYADMIVHRQLQAILSNTPWTEDIDFLTRTADSFNVKEESAQNAQEQSVHIEACRAMDKVRLATDGDYVVEGIVVAVYESAFDVLIPEWGFEKRVHCDQLPLKKAEFRKEKRILELYWEKGVPSSAYIPEDERPKANGNRVAAARQAEEADRAKKEREEATRKQTDTGTMSTNEVDALFDDDDNASDITQAGVSLSVDRSTQSVPGSPKTKGEDMQRSRSDSRVQSSEARQTIKDKWQSVFKLREEDGEFIQDVIEMTRVPIIVKTDLSKSPPCLTVRSVNPYAL